MKTFEMDIFPRNQEISETSLSWSKQTLIRREDIKALGLSCQFFKATKTNHYNDEFQVHCRDLTAPRILVSSDDRWSDSVCRLLHNLLWRWRCGYPNHRCSCNPRMHGILSVHCRSAEPVSHVCTSVFGANSMKALKPFIEGRISSKLKIVNTSTPATSSFVHQFFTRLYVSE